MAIESKKKNRKTVEAERNFKKLVSMDEPSGLSLDESGNFIIKTKDDANKAVGRAGKLIEEIDQIKSETKLVEKEATYNLLRKNLASYQTDKEIMSVVSGAWKSDLVERENPLWVWDIKDIPEAVLESLEEPPVPLRTVVRRKFRDIKRRTKVIDKLTVRVPVAAAIDDAVKTGLLTEEDVANSLIYYVGARYVQVKENK